MTTQEVANRLVELCRQGKITETQQELFSDDVTSIERAGGMSTVTGKAAVIEKSNQFATQVEQVHASEISEPVIAGEWFSIGWLFDVTMKGHGRMPMKEVCVYQVKDGKIISEEFFF